MRLVWSKVIGPAVLAGTLLLSMAWDTFNVALLFRTGPRRFAASQALGHWYVDTFPPDAVIFQRDWVGEPTFWSRRHVIDGGGFMNNAEYQGALLNHRLVEYLRDHGVTHAAWDGLEGLPDAAALLDSSYQRLLYPVLTIQRGRACGENEFLLRRQWEISRYRHLLPNRSGTRDLPPATFCAWKLPEHWTPADLRATQDGS
jgi:hypothetical protein